MGRPTSPFLRQHLTRRSISLPLPKGNQQSQPSQHSQHPFSHASQVQVKVKARAKAKYTASVKAELEGFRNISWKDIRHKKADPVEEPEPAPRLDTHHILNPSWLGPHHKLFPRPKYFRNLQERRLFHEHQFLRFQNWKSEANRQLRPKYFVLPEESPGLRKVGHEQDPALLFHPSMVASLEILTTPTADTPGGAVFLRFDHRSYVFGNASEGTQRVFTSRGLAMAKIEDIFLTGPIDWQTSGGLLGMILTMADIRSNQIRDRKDRLRAKELERSKRQVQGDKGDKGNKGRNEAKPAPRDPRLELDHINIHGGRNLTHMLATARGFIFRNGYPLRPQEVRTDPRPDKDTCSSEHDWEDENIRVWHVPVWAKQQEQQAQQQEEQQQPPPQKSKKRTSDQISDSDGEDPAKAQPQPTVSEDKARDEARSQELLYGVVKNMFNSAGILDGLYETEIKDVDRISSTQFYSRRENREIVPYAGEMIPNAKVMVRRPALISTLPPTAPERMSMCYVVKTKVTRGKFFPDKAVALGVPRQKFKCLVAGESVPGHGGMLVTPEMVIGASPEPNGFAVVELPDETYIEPFLERPEWKNEDIMRGTRAMYWIVRKAEMLEDDRILAFMREHSGPRHIVLSRTADISPIVLEGAALETTKLHMIDGNVFPLLPYSDPEEKPGAGSGSEAAGATPYRHGRLGAQITLSPKLSFNDDRGLKPIDARAALRQFASDNTEILVLAKAAEDKTSDPAFLAAVEAADGDIPNRDAEVVPLGTGSALPSKTRNVSSTLLRIPGIGSYLLDCGENTLGQLRRMYGFAGADEILKDLRAVWISHSHADHHLGTISILRRYSEVVPAPAASDSKDDDKDAVGDDNYNNKSNSRKPLALIAHPLYHNFISEYADVEDFGLDTHVYQLPNAAPTSRRDTRPPPPGPSRRVSTDHHPRALLRRFGLDRLAVCRVDHCADAHAVALTFSSGLKVAYSGDCRPSADFALPDVGGGAHLLIHEATLEDAKRADAVAKKHCTVSEALAVARAMRARNVLLTHFSQRYPQMPVFDQSAVAALDGGGGGGGGDVPWDAPVLVAFDYMRVRLGEFRRAREFLPALQKLYEAPDLGEGEGQEAGPEEAAVVAQQRAAA